MLSKCRSSTSLLSVRWRHTCNLHFDSTMSNCVLNSIQRNLVGSLRSWYWQSPHSGPLTNNCNGIAHSDENKQRIHDFVDDDVLIVGAINAVSVCCGSHLTWGLFTQTESFQPLWSEGIGAVPALCPAWMPCPGARRRWHERISWTVEKNPRHPPGGSQGGIMVEQTQCSHHQDPALPQLGAYEFSNSSTLCFTFSAANV